MSFRVTPLSPHRPADSASSSATSPRQSPGATTQQVHSDLPSRAHGHSSTQAPLAPRHRLETSGPGNQEERGLLSRIESMTHAVLHPQMQATFSALERLGEALASPFMPSHGFHATGPAATWPAPPRPYVAPSLAGYQSVPLAQMRSKDARAALLAMDLSPQFLDAMKADLDRSSTPAGKQQFVAKYGQLVAMPNGLDSATVAKLGRMLASPEPPRAQAASLQQKLPVSEMKPEDARAALRAMEVPPQVLARMTKDMLGCVETAGCPEGQQRAQQFRHDYGHLLALPQHMNAATLTDLVNLLMDLDEVEPQAESHTARHLEPPQAQLTALAAMDPADARQALLALDVPEQQLCAMAEDLHGLVVALLNESGNEQPYHELAHEFAQAHGHLIELPAPLDVDALHALVQILQPSLKEEQEEAE